MTAMTAALRAPVAAPAFRRPAAKPAAAPPRGPATRAPSAPPRRPAYASVFAGFRGAFGVV